MLAAASNRIARLRHNQKEALDAASAFGLPRQSARVLTACLTGESLVDPDLKRWDRKHYSQGIAQWDDNRSKRIAAKFGAPPARLTVAEQVRALLWEAEKFYPRTFAALCNPRLSAREQMRVLVKDFERPAAPETEIKKRMAFYEELGVA